MSCVAACWWTCMLEYVMALISVPGMCFFKSKCSPSLYNEGEETNKNYTPSLGLESSWDPSSELWPFCKQRSRLPKTETKIRQEDYTTETGCHDLKIWAFQTVPNPHTFNIKLNCQFFIHLNFLKFCHVPEHAFHGLHVRHSGKISNTFSNDSLSVAPPKGLFAVF